VTCPPFAGYRTVQKAIERLCQQQSAGCATYVLSPGSDWRAVLAGLKPGENAHICFRRGDYEVDRAIELKGLGNIILSGTGAGSAIVAAVECALHFVDCESLHVSALRFVAPKPSQPEAPQPDLNGVLTTTRVAEVAVVDCNFLTASSPRRDRACLRIRQTTQGRAEGQTRRVLVRDNRFLVSDGQIGVLVDDAGIVIIEDNEIAAFGEIEGGGDGQRPDVAKALAERILRAPLIGLPDPEAPAERRVSAGRFTATLTSAVSQEDWVRGLRARPPVEVDLADETAFGRYIRRLGAAMAEEAGADPRAFPSLSRAVATLRIASAGNAPREAIARLVVSGDAVTVKPVTEMETGRGVNLDVGPHRVAFDSVFSEAEWRRILQSVGAEGVGSDEALRELLRRTTERLVMDRALRERLPFVRDFFDKATRHSLAAVGQAIVCAGSRLDEVSVRRNSMTGVLEGIRVAVSHPAPPGADPDIVGSLDVSDNRIALRVPLNRAVGDQGIQIGNARRAVIGRNEVTYVAEERGQAFGVGIDMVGVYGAFVLVAENLIEARLGLMRQAIRMRHVPGEPSGQEVLWRAVGNAAVGFNESAFQFARAFRLTDNQAIPV
jgi:hypothetical protein